MTKKLEEILDLAPIDEQSETQKSVPELIEESKELISALTNSDRIDAALKDIDGLTAHDEDMDDIAKKAMESFEELKRVGLNVHDMYVGKIYEIANQMLNTAMQAKDAKVQKKLKMLDLLIKKHKIDNDNDEVERNRKESEFDRNELLKQIVSIQDGNSE